MLALEAISLVALVFWVLVVLDRPRSWPGEVVLQNLPDCESLAIEGSVAVIVPARNESSTLPETLPSLLQQDVTGMKIFLVDDGSSDDTRSVVEALTRGLGAEDKIQIVAASSKIDGWSGKVHAQLCGYVAMLERAVEDGVEPPEWLLLTDADIRHRPGSVQSLLARASGSEGAERLDLVSVMARLRAEDFWEQIIVPAFVFFFQLMYPFRRVGDTKSRVAASAGGCVLVRRKSLEDAGGFAAIGGEIIDDVALGRLIKRSHGSLWLGLDPGISSIRVYSGLGELWRMVSRTAFDQLHYRWDLLVLTLVALLILLVSPPLVIAGSLYGLLGEHAGDTALLRTVGWAGMTWVLMAAAYFPAVRYHRVPGIYAWTLPFAAVLFALMTTSSAWIELTGKGPSWRGRSYGSS